MTLIMSLSPPVKIVVVKRMPPPEPDARRVERATLAFCAASALVFALTLVALALAVARPLDRLDAADVEYFAVRLDAQSAPARIVDDRFLSFGLDASMLAAGGADRLNLDSPRLRNLTRLLGPSRLRLGGTMSDRLVFMEGGGRARRDVDPDASVAKFLPYFVMSGDDWRAVNEFCRATDARLMFDLNALLRRDDGGWDSSNAERLLAETRRLGYADDVDWQLGNEPNSFRHVFNETVAPRRLAADFVALRRLLNEYAPRSKLVGPDTTRPQPARPECLRYMREFLDALGDDADGVLGAIGWHQYYVNGRTATVEDFWSVDTFDLLGAQIDDMTRAISRHLARLPMWLTETSSAYGGGAPLLSDSFAGSALWLDKLGLAAAKGVSLVVRQSLVGGNYCLIDDLTETPLPDWWVGFAHRRLVGARVLSCAASSSRRQRLYCQCGAEEGDVVVFGVNLDAAPAAFDFVGTALREGGQVEVDEYVLTPRNGVREARQVLLNGAPLEYDGDEPELVPVRRSAAETMLMPGYSLGFWVLKGATMPACA